VPLLLPSVAAAHAHSDESSTRGQTVKWQKCSIVCQRPWPVTSMRQWCIDTCYTPFHLPFPLFAERNTLSEIKRPSWCYIGSLTRAFWPHSEQRARCPCCSLQTKRLLTRMQPAQATTSVSAVHTPAHTAMLETQLRRPQGRISGIAGARGRFSRASRR
jgi:hypothetical protein